MKVIQMPNEKSYLLSNDPACKETHLQFGIFGRNLEPSEISRILNFQPTTAFAKGDLVQSSSGKRKRPIGTWQFSTQGLLASTSPEKHAEYLLERLESSLDDIKNVACTHNYRIVISVWWESVGYHGSLTFSSEILQRLGRMCDEIQFFFISSSNS